MNKSILGAGFLCWLVLLLSGCGYSLDENRQLLEGEWQFQSAEMPGESDIQIGPSDHLIVNTDYSFTYSIASMDLQRAGSWDLFGDDQLRLIYDQQPGEDRMTRVNYTIEQITPDLLILSSQEGHHYQFNRR